MLHLIRYTDMVSYGDILQSCCVLYMTQVWYFIETLDPMCCILYMTQVLCLIETLDTGVVSHT